MGEFLAGLRLRAPVFKWLLLAALVLLVGLNTVLLPEHPHVDAEHLPGFWAVFALGVAVAMAAVLKTIVAPLLAVDEDHYD